MSLFRAGVPAFARRHINVLSALTGVMALVLTVAAFSTRTHGTAWPVWLPATGLAVGVASWYRPRDAWRISLVAGVASGLGSIISGRPLAVCVAITLVAALETWVGSRVLRGRTGRSPTLADLAALRRLLLAAGAVGIVTAVGLGLGAAIAFGPAQVVPTLIGTTATHVAATLLLAPLFFVAPPAMHRTGRLPMLVQWATLAATVALTFGFSAGPIAFLVLPPLVWGASVLPYRQFLVQLALTSLAISELTAASVGPFGSPANSESIRSLLAGGFSLTVGVLVFAMIAVASQERSARTAIDRRDAVYRETMEASVMGVTVLTDIDGSLGMSELNPSGREILGVESADTIPIVDVFTVNDARLLRRAVEQLATDPDIGWSKENLATQSGRVLEASLFAVVGPVERRAALQFIDVTARERLLEEDSLERKRAVDIQAALVPGSQLLFPGYEVAGRSVASRALGGDFYDWYAIAGGFAVTLGDVMGKGAGASMVAAALRIALRLESETHAPATALARVARVIEGELSAAQTFATVFTAHFRAEDGRIRYADAGHGLALLCRSDGIVGQLDSRGLPVGVMAGSRWINRSARLEPGDTLVIFSDGVLDLFDGSLIAFDEIGRMSASAASTGDLLDKIYQLVNPDSLDDDVTVIAIRRARDA